MTSWTNEAEVEIPEGAIQVLYWRLLVMPIAPPKQTASGIFIPTEAQDNAAHLEFRGKVVQVGDLVGCKRDFDLPSGEKCRLPKVGDWVTYGKYAGQRISYKGTKLIMLNDDEVTSIVSNPDDIVVYIS